MKRKRARGTGTIFKNKHGHFNFQYIDIDGKKKTTTLKDDDGKPVTVRMEADKAADKFFQQINALQQLTSKAEYLAKVAEVKQLVTFKRITLGNLWDYYLNSPNRPDSSEPTLTSYRSTLCKFLDYCQENGVTQTCEITPEHAGQYMVNYWNTNVASRTYNKHLQGLKLIFKTVLGDECKRSLSYIYATVLVALKYVRNPEQEGGGRNGEMGCSVELLA